jgi:hypothetical protein
VNRGALTLDLLHIINARHRTESQAILSSPDRRRTTPADTDLLPNAPARPKPRLTDASHSIAVTGMFNAHHPRASPSCHQEPVRAAQCQLQVPRTTVR